MSGATFQVLALDGGGIRGAYSAAFLAELERLLGHPVAKHFDLLAGTSTGGIIATALAFGVPAKAIETLYRDNGHSMFMRERTVKPPLGLRVLAWLLRSRLPDLARDPASLLEAKYSPQPLRTQLEALLGARLLEEASTRLLLPSVDVGTGQTVVFKTPHLPALVRDRTMRAVDVVLATAAAPTYFPPHEPQSGGAYCDGGLWANNPAIVGYAEAVKISANCRRQGIDPEFSHENVRMLSVGTGAQPYRLRPPGARAGLGYWGPVILDVMGAAQSQGIDFQAQYLLGERYARVNFQVPDGSWKLDRVDVVEELLHLGREAATSRWAALQSYLKHDASPLRPFPIQSAAVA